jgi:hypothetical protein
MQGAQSRYLVLIALLVGAYLLVDSIAEGQPIRAARWPTEDAVYAVDGWSVGPEIVNPWWGYQNVVRVFRGPDGLPATLLLVTAPEAKQIYRNDADLAFLGSGYTVSEAPQSVVPPMGGRGAQIAQRGDERWLLLYAYGERRGLVTYPLLGWATAGFDGLLGRPNDYFLARVAVPIEHLDAPSVQRAVALADVLFARLASWYGDPTSTSVAEIQTAVR